MANILAYLNSFAMIYLVWYKHYHLFKKIETISMKLFFLNGVWLFFLTLVPFATGWVGEFPFSPLPECSYALIILIWSSSLELIDRQIMRETGLEREYYHAPKIRIFNYISFITAMIVAYVEPILCLTIIFLISVINVIVISRKNNDNV